MCNKVINKNSKTGISLELTSICPHAKKGKPCLYCYVELPRGYEKATGNRIAMTSNPVERLKYNGEILKLSNEEVERQNKQGGMRLFSLGDYFSWMDEDLKQIIIDANKKKLQLKAITKQLSFVRKYAGYDCLTIQISIDNLGKYSRAPSLKKAIEYRDKYNKNALYPPIKIRFVAMNRKEAEWAYKNSDIDVLTLGHFRLTKPNMVNSICASNLKLTKEEIEKVVDKWENMDHRTLLGQELMNKYKKKVCCYTGKCWNCEVRCGLNIRSWE